MDPQQTLYAAWAALVIFLIVGLLVYERTGMRLGGVLVLPLLLVYALLDVRVVAIFAISATVALLLGEFVHRYGLVYGRRLLYVFLLVGVVTTMLAHARVELAATTFIIGLLPGLFAYNLHREGRYLEGASAFALWFGALLIASVAAAWLLTEPTNAHALAAGISERLGFATTRPMALEHSAGVGTLLVASVHAMQDAGAAE